ncbi:CCCH-type zinc finger protein with ARM repeat domain-containing protein [Actinidia rufa]|uniref:CCCH-type zinc finger protein with ARM repeat domain-containing protein n=1 Tax=Actinidia rufa TaxID=165716 RepID=A0A7J0FHS0_9ERIC|nr:CCCH-type zinc finger protein with ARM repeat domain-containing protein [Actinidia rufa]
MNNLTLETDDTFASLLELAANNDVEGFKRSIERDLAGIDEIGLWYGRKKGSKHMVLEHRTPLMVASTYGSIDVVKLILSVSNSDINRTCGFDKTTALHCAASGGSINALDVVKVLLEAGADPNLVDANGHCPFDVIVVSPKFQDSKFSLEKLLATNAIFSLVDLRSSLNARDIAAEDLDMFSDFDLQQKQLLNELSRLSRNRSAHSKTLTTPSNLEDLFSSESSSPRPRSGFHRCLPRGMDPISPMSSRVSILSQHQQQQLRSLSSRDLGSNSSAIGGDPSWAKWGSSNGKPDWGVNADEFGKLERSSSFELGNNGEEPDLSWVQSLVKESPQETKEKSETGTLGGVGSSGEGSNLNSSQIEPIDQSIGSECLAGANAA